MQVQANGIHIEVQDEGPSDGEPLLLVMGLGMQLIGWPDELVTLLAGRGFRVIRIDNRDAGLSQGFDHLGTPSIPWAALRYALRLRVRSPYALADMAVDAIGVLDALGLARAHVCGASMGGMIAQHMAAREPARIKSLVLMMSTSGDRRLPQAASRARRALLSRPDGSEPACVVAHLERLLTVIGSPAYPPDAERLRQRLQIMVARAWRPAGTMRQLAAVVADGDRNALLSRIKAPALVIHGRDDPLVPVACGLDLAQRIPGAVGDYVPGMGHDLPLQLLPHFAAAIAENAWRGGVQPDGPIQRAKSWV